MTRAKAIAKKCLECSGDSAKEATLCQVFDCALWEYRLGGKDPKSTRSRERMAAAFRRWRKEFEIMLETGIDIAVFARRHGVRGPLAKNSTVATLPYAKTKT